MPILYVDFSIGNDSRSRAQAMSQSTPWLTIRKAADLAEPGDEVQVKGNGHTYIEFYASSGFAIPTLNTVNHGTSVSPIRFRPFPGHAVTIKNTNFHPVIGSNKDYVIWEGFTIIKDANQVGGEGPNQSTYGAALTDCTGSEIGYCTIISFAPPASNGSAVRCGVRGGRPQDCRVHHCDISGFTSSAGNQLNHAAIVTWGQATSNFVIEDNYLHDNGTGIYDKDEAQDTHVRRNYIRGHTQSGFGGSNQTTNFLEARWHIYDNVFGDPINPHYICIGSTCHDNLFITSGFNSTAVSTNPNMPRENSIWNNVHTTSPPRAWDQNHAYDTHGPAFTYFDHNIYVGDPVYGFDPEGTNKTFTQMKALEFELSSQRNIPLANIYNDTGTGGAWTLKAAYQTAGRGGAFKDTVGPTDDNGNSIVATILDTTRYGAAAYTGAPSTPTNNPPTAILSITSISSLTVNTSNAGSVDSDGTIVSRNTDWGDGSADSTTSTPSHTYAEAGTYLITLTVTDDDGATGQATQQVTVGAPAYVQKGVRRIRPARSPQMAGWR